MTDKVVNSVKEMFQDIVEKLNNALRDCKAKENTTKLEPDIN